VVGGVVEAAVEREHGGVLRACRRHIVGDSAE
jgi:hypothetical protein